MRYFLAVIRPRHLVCLLVLAWGSVSASSATFALAERPWIEARSRNFVTYSCGSTQDVARLAARLEQFRSAYAMLAGTQAVASPPIVVIAFPDHATMQPFLPLYQGKAMNLAGFFSRGQDENLIVMTLAATGGSLETIYHEYAHLLLRHNERYWPMWMKEGMAEIWAGFEVTGPQTARIGKAFEKYTRILESQELMSLQRLMRVTRESREYNERERQGSFYATSWLLTHYLMLGNKAHKQRLGQFTTALRNGTPVTRAFTNTFQTSLPAMEAELRAYLEKGNFPTLLLGVRGDLRGPQALALRRLSPAETCFHLGNELMRVGRSDAAASWFAEVKRRAPESALAFEGLGTLSAESDDHHASVPLLAKAIELGSTSYLVRYLYARELFRSSAIAPDTYARLPNDLAGQIRSTLDDSLARMPDFGPAYHLLGLLEMVQGNRAGAISLLQKATELEPENEAFARALARAQGVPTPEE